MHYTSLENIHKVIDELFLDDLRNEFNAIKNKKKLADFHDKLANIKIFDPACGSGNFLTESYLSLRRLENDLLKKMLGSQIQLGEFVNPIKISIAQFYGIEINDFAVAVAQTALWIAELQMMIETQAIIHRDLNFLPLKSYANIIKGNALCLDWKDFFKVNSTNNLTTYIIGNPPFVGKTYQTDTQKADLIAVDKRLKPLDYVTGWYFKAIDFMRHNNATRTAFVSTNSITQGEQVGYFWQMFGCHIDFAYRTFIWDSESTDKAHVHCVVVGLSVADYPKPKKIFTDKNNYELAQNINGYLHFIKKEPLAKKFIYRYMGADDFINNKLRYCLWLVNATPAEIRKMKLVYERIKKVREFRLKSKAEPTRKFAETPHLFAEIRQSKTNFLFIPQVSSERRRYVPIGFMTPDIIASNLVLIIPDATLYDFGVLTSSIHMAWMRTVAGRLKSDYRYSATIVYNNFVWSEPSDSQKRAIEATAQAILDVRARYPDSTLADLYDELTMPSELRLAHRQNDIAVAKTYGFEEILDDEAQIVRELFQKYAELTEK